MRTLYEIVEAAKDAQPVTPDETRYAMLVLSALLNLAMHDIVGLGDEDVALVQGHGTGRKARRWQAEEAYRRYRTALATDPKAYLGNDVPENPAYQQFRVIGKRLIDKALAGELPTQQGKQDG